MNFYLGKDSDLQKVADPDCVYVGSDTDNMYVVVDGESHKISDIIPTNSTIPDSSLINGKMYFEEDTSKLFYFNDEKLYIGSSDVKLDKELTPDGTNAVEGRAIYEAIANMTGANPIIIDNAMSDTSENPVQNKVINAALFTKVDKEVGKGLSSNDFTDEEKQKLANLSGVDIATTKKVGLVKPDGSTITITNDGKITANTHVTVDNVIDPTSENPVQNKVIAAALDGKVDKEDGKGLSSNDFTNDEKTKLSTLKVITVDSALSASSTNPVQNKVIFEALQNAGGGSTVGIATLVKAGIVKPDGDTIIIDNDGTISVNGGSSVPIASIDRCGIAKPDGSTITIKSDGTLVVTGISDADTALSANSIKPVQNQAIYKAWFKHEQDLMGKANLETVNTKFGEIDDSITTINDTLGTKANSDDVTNALALKADSSDVQALATDVSNKVDKVTGKGLSTEDYTTEEKQKLSTLNPVYTATTTSLGIVKPDGVSIQISADGTINAVAGTVDNELSETSENGIQNKVVTAELKKKANSDDVTNALALKVDKETGKGLSTEDYTTVDKQKLADIDVATTTKVGLVKPDGTSILISADGTINAVAGTVDNELSSTSENSVQNKVIKAALDTKADSSDLQALSTTVAGKVDSIAGKGLSTEDYTTEEKQKLNNLADIVVESSLSSTSENPVQNKVIKSELDKKADSSTMTTELAKKVDSIAGKGLSTEDYTTEEKQKLSTLQNTVVDSALSSTSENPVQNKIITDALNAKADSSDLQALSTTVAGKADSSDLQALSTTVAGKVDQEAGKGLSSNDYSNEEKQKITDLIAAVGQLNTEKINTLMGIADYNTATRNKIDALTTRMDKEVGDVSTIGVSNSMSVVDALNELNDNDKRIAIQSVTFAQDANGKYIETINFKDSSVAPITVDLSSMISNIKVGDLSDVNSASIADNQVLAFDTASSKYVPKTFDLAGVLSDAKAYTDTTLTNINQASVISVDAKPTYSDGVITYVEDGNTKTTTDTNTWFYYIDGTDYVRTMFINGKEVTMSLSQSINLTDYVSKTKDVSSVYTENMADTSKIPSIKALNDLLTIVVGKIAGKVNVADIIDDTSHSDTNKPASARTVKELRDMIDNAFTSITGTGGSTVMKRIFKNVVSGTTYTFDSPLTLQYGAVINVYKQTTARENLTEVIGQPTEDTKADFVYNPDDSTVTGGFKDRFELPFTLNSDGMYYTDTINKSDYMALVGIE